jgi:heptosyltransferase-2
MHSGQPAGPRVLVHLPNWLGDVLMTTPLLTYLADAFAARPAASRPSLHLAVNRSWSMLFAADPRLSGQLVLDRGDRHGGVAGLWRLAADFRRGAYDAVLIGPPSLRAGLAAALARIPVRVGRASDARGPLLRPALAVVPRGSRHFSREMLELGQALLDTLGLAAPALPAEGLPLPAVPGCDSVPAAVAGADKPLWVVAPGTTYGEAKTWPVARVADFLGFAVGQAGVRVALVGDAQASGFAAELRESSGLAWSRELKLPADVIDLTGRTSLRDVVSILKSATAFVGNDSGLMHLAGALGLPTVGIFGSSNPDWTHPLGRRTAAVCATGFACRPCYRRTCNQPTFCLETVSATEVLGRLNEVLARKPAPGEGV